MKRDNTMIWTQSDLLTLPSLQSNQQASIQNYPFGPPSEKVIGKMREISSIVTPQHLLTVGRSHCPIPLDTAASHVLGGNGEERQDATACYLNPPDPITCSGTDKSYSGSNRSQGFGFEGAGKYLLSGGIAGAVSRTATAPFDRLKIYLITTQPSIASTDPTRRTERRWFSHLWQSLKLIYNEHSDCHQHKSLKNSRHKWGFRNFFIGNGLNVLKVFPESAIKFFVYEYCKNLFDHYQHLNYRRHHHHHPSSSSSSSSSDLNQLPHRSNLSRFLAGGIAGVVSQVLIYPIETLKTQLMSSTINEKFQGRALLIYTIKKLNQTGKLRGYYTGITVAATGVFPYSAIDMSAFETLKRAYQTTTGGTETGVIATLMCGAMSGGVGASVVYPLNVVRTRLQAQGTPYHPQIYQGVIDCIRCTYLQEGWSGFYRGLAPSLMKVIPAVSISWLVYEQSNSLLDSLYLGP